MRQCLYWYRGTVKLPRLRYQSAEDLVVERAARLPRSEMRDKRGVTQESIRARIS